MNQSIIFCSFVLFIKLTQPVGASVPLVINTWAFTQATEKGMLPISMFKINISVH